MRAIHWARLDKRAPVLVLTSELTVGRMSTVTVALITGTNRIATEMPVGWRNELEQDSAAKCDQIVTIPLDRLREQCEWLPETQELAPHEAIQAAFDLV